MQIYPNAKANQPKNTYLGQKGYTIIKNELTIDNKNKSVTTS